MKKQTQLSNQIKKLQYQLSYSQHINKQLSMQLATMCKKLGISPSKFKQNSDIGLINTTMHLQELYYVQPLLMCYEENFVLMRTELEEAKEDAKGIQAHVDKIVGENSFLRRELQAKIQLLTKSDNLGINVNFLNLENKDLKDKIGILNAKIQFMARKNKQLSQDYQKLKTQNLSLFGKNDLDKLQTKAKQDSKLAQTQLINTKAQIQILKNKLQNQRSIVLQQQKKLSTMQNQIIKLRSDLKLQSQKSQNSLTVHQHAHQSLLLQLQTLKQQLSQSQKAQQSLFSKSLTLESTVQDLTSKVHNLSLQNSQLQANNNNMLQMLENYQVKVNQLKKSLKKMEAEAREIGEERAQLAKRADIAQWRLGEKEQEMERKEGQWRKERTRIGKMWEDRLDAVRKGFGDGGKV